MKQVTNSCPGAFLVLIFFLMKLEVCFKDMTVVAQLGVDWMSGTFKRHSGIDWFQVSCEYVGISSLILVRFSVTALNRNSLVVGLLIFLVFDHNESPLASKGDKRSKNSDHQHMVCEIVDAIFRSAPVRRRMSRRWTLGDSSKLLEQLKLCNSMWSLVVLQLSLP